MTDNINPSHYQSGIQPDTYIAAQKLNFRRGSVIKYMSRAGKKKGAPELEDLMKARWFLLEEIACLEKQEALKFNGGNVLIGHAAKATTNPVFTGIDLGAAGEAIFKVPSVLQEQDPDAVFRECITELKTEAKGFPTYADSPLAIFEPPQFTIAQRDAIQDPRDGMLIDCGDDRSEYRWQLYRRGCWRDWVGSDDVEMSTEQQWVKSEEMRTNQRDALNTPSEGMIRIQVCKDGEWHGIADDTNHLAPTSYEHQFRVQRFTDGKWCVIGDANPNHLAIGRCIQEDGGKYPRRCILVFNHSRGCCFDERDQAVKVVSYNAGVEPCTAKNRERMRPKPYTDDELTQVEKDLDREEAYDWANVGGSRSTDSLRPRSIIEKVEDIPGVIVIDKTLPERCEDSLKLQGGIRYCSLDADHGGEHHYNLQDPVTKAVKSEERCYTMKDDERCVSNQGHEGACLFNPPSPPTVENAGRFPLGTEAYVAAAAEEHEKNVATP